MKEENIRYIMTVEKNKISRIYEIIKSLQPRDSHGRFTFSELPKNVSLNELTKEQAEELINALKSLPTVEMDGVKVSIDKARKSIYKNEIEQCKLLVEAGHDVYLLPENYFYGKHADTLTDDDFLELKETERNVTGNYRKAREQAINCLISIKDNITASNAINQIQRRIKDNLKNKRNTFGIVYLFLEKTNKFIEMKINRDGNFSEKTVPTSVSTQPNSNERVEANQKEVLASPNNSLSNFTNKSIEKRYKMKSQDEMTSICINITNITELNKSAKIEKLDRLFKSILKHKDVAAAGFELGKNVSEKEYFDFQKSITVPKNIKQYNDIELNIDNFDVKDSLRLEKALRTMSFALDVPLKAARGETFLYNAQEELTRKWCAYFSTVTRKLYDMIIHYFSLPEKTVMTKSDVLTYKGKVLYSPETGEPIPLKYWNHFVKTLETFLNKNLKDSEKKIILESKSLGKILNRMAKYNTFEAIQKMKLDAINYHGKTFDWISDSVKNMKNAFGDDLTRIEQARIEVMQQSAAMRISKISDIMKNDVKQILIDGIKNKKSRGQVSQDLFDKMVGHNRDFQRIADTEIQNAVNNANVKEIVQNANENESIYFQRIEIVDSNTCDYCKKMNGIIAKWSTKPLKNEKINDKIAKYALWDGKEWSGKGHNVSIGAFHPWCRGSWVEYSKDKNVTNALAAKVFNRGKKWNNSVEQAKKEFAEKKIFNADDRTPGFIERINELMNE